MLHQLDSAGVDEAAVIKACERSGRPIPEKILNAPTLNLGLDLFYRAFMQLGSCRTLGMEEGPIPWTAICMWCNENEIEGAQRGRMFHNVRAMDNAYMAYRAGKMSK